MRTDWLYSAQYLLTEVGHGLDARNLETTATWLANGEFDLHSPTKDAAKYANLPKREISLTKYRYMPMITPQEGFERVGIVFARLLAEGEDRGPRPFVVKLNDGHSMCSGITAK